MDLVPGDPPEIAAYRFWDMGEGFRRPRFAEWLAKMIGVVAARLISKSFKARAVDAACRQGHLDLLERRSLRDCIHPVAPGGRQRPRIVIGEQPSFGHNGTRLGCLASVPAT